VNAGIRGLVWAGLLAACSSAPARYPEQERALGIEYAGRSGGETSSTASSSPDFSNRLGLVVPHRTHITDSARLVVRPDLLRVGFAIRELGTTPQTALQAARAKVDSVSAELVKATRPSTLVKIKSFTLERHRRDEKVVEISASVDGAVEVPLAPSEDFWARGQLYASLIDAEQRLVAALDGEDGLRAVSFEAPEAQVLDPEQHRPELIERWVARARQFAAAAQTEGSPLAVRDCDPPGPVVQTARSFDEVSLELLIGCRIDTRSDTGASGK